MKKFRKKTTLFVALFLFWLGLSGSLETSNILVGALLSYFVMRVTWKPLQAEKFIVGDLKSPVRRMVYAFAFIPYFSYAVIASAISVSIIALRYNLNINPGIIKHKSRLKGRFSLVLLSNYITLTPGTLTMDLDTNERILYIHCIDTKDPKVIGEINSIERWLEIIFE